MTDPDLPQPIYPPQGPTDGNGGWAAPPGPPAPPAYGTSGGGPGGYGPTGPAGPSKRPGRSKPPVAAIAVAALVVVLGVVGVVVSKKDSDKPTRKPTATTPARTTPTRDPQKGGGATLPTVPRTRAGEDAPTTDNAVAKSIADRQLAGADPATIECMVGELENAPDVVAQIKDDSVVSIDDPTVASEYAAMLVGCSNPQELEQMLRGLLTGGGVDPTATECIITNARSFGTTQWEQFITSSVQPSEASYLTQLLNELSTC